MPPTSIQMHKPDGYVKNSISLKNRFVYEAVMGVKDAFCWGGGVVGVVWMLNTDLKDWNERNNRFI